MFAYYLELAVRSLRRSPGLTALMILAIGFGVAASMTMYSVFRGVSADPIPWKSSQLFVPQIDAWGPGHGENGEPPTMLTYIDAMALTRQHRAFRQSAIVAMWRSIMPPSTSPSDSLIETRGYAVDNEFFPMLDVPFHYGSGWSTDDDAHQIPVMVISDHFNQEMFGGGNSVGKTIDIGNHAYRIVGITRHWNPQPEFFALFRYQADEPDFFLPVQFAVANNVVSDNRANCKDGPYPGTDFAALLRSDCTWLSYMVELDSPAAAQAYRQYLDAYASEQQQIGRFPWRPNNRLRDVPAFLDYQHVVPSNTRVSLLVAQGLLVVCLVNTVGLLLAKFLRRSGEIAVRRALGASRASIYAQFLTEAGVIGVGGGLLGLLFTAIGVLSVGVVMPARLAVLARIDPALLLLTLLLAVTATLLAAVYPTYRASRVPPALQLKAP
ncbi:ABC transporter permease [Dyella nitratireducens]|uniref:ABC transporter permease n=1 Tax=Dyella nitratireducens TaxID=1849580 RepID=UPI001669E268|nr:ABC transporter permease [Dyella nitratireducens]GLQ44511.1 ABC transporter ATP-binding protein [Dyella nitratireducens]